MKSELQLLPVDQPVPAVWDGQAATSLLDIIVFSKDRPAQLDALLRSVRAFMPYPHRLHVLYTTTTAGFESGYDRLRRWHRGVRWRPDENQFRGALLGLLKTISSGPGRYLMFAVDDMLFTRPFTAMDLMRSLDEDEAILAVSLRLGEDIRYCYPRDCETRPPDFSDGYRWAWKEASPGYWNYPMSLDGHVFRTTDLAVLIPRLNFAGPNSLESALAGHPLARPDLVCEAVPTVLNVAANRVQEVVANRCGNQDAESLNRSFLDGNAVDVRAFAGKRFNACHVEQELPLMVDEREPEPTGWKRIARDGRDYLRIDLREIPTFILNCADDARKRLLMVEQMAELGLNYEFIPTLRVTPGWVGVALGHLKALRLSRARPPFLVLEDDCVFDEHFRPVIEVPAQADCLYLGASIFGLREPGRMSWGRAGGVLWERFDKDYLRVYNMLARHALLYLKPGFQQAVIESQVEALTNRHLPHMGDIGLAMLQPAYTALLTARSQCRQLDRDATAGDLADLLPGNEQVGGKAIAPEQGLARLPTAKFRSPGASCLISHKYRFIYFQIGKNASSTLKAEFFRPRYECEQVPVNSLDEATLDAYFTFTFLRDPVTRLVSAYQEISMRHEMKDSAIGAKPFLEMEEGPERFEAFLDEVEKDKWDKHVATQTRLLGSLPVDFHGRVETLAADLQQVFDTLDLGPCPDLPRRRSRSGRQANFGYTRFNLDHHELNPEQIARIRRLYREDVDRVEAHCPVPALFTGESRGGPSSQARALSILADEDAAPSELYTRVNEQHEACFVYVFGNRGFYAEVSTVVRAMIYCWAHGYRLLLDSSASAWAHEQGWTDYFEPFGAESSEVAAGQIVERCDFARREDRPVWRRLIRFAPRELDFGRETIRGFGNIMAFFTSLAFRPTPECQAVVDRLTDSLNLSEDYDAIHVRRGDKVEDEDISYPAQAYLDRLTPLRSGQTLFVMSDDRAAVEEVIGYLRDRGDAVRVASLAEPERAGFNVTRLCEGRPFMGDDSGPTDGSGHREYVRDATRMLIAETLIAARSRRFVSTWRSNVGRMISCLHRDRQSCELLHPESQAAAQQGSGGGAGEGRSGRRANATAESTWHGVVQMRDGTVHEFDLPADSPYIESLRKRINRGEGARCAGDAGLFQVPLHHGRAALTFSGADIHFASLVPPAEDGTPHHPLTHAAEGHLGGYLRSCHPLADRYGTQHGDPATYAPELWQWVLDTLGVKSVLDVGCGEGHAAAYFRDHGCTVLGVDGSAQAERDTVIPGLHRRHDYTRGPLVPPGEWDLVWSCEFVEHVEERFSPHFLATFACARKYVLMTFAPPGQTGWHHVNCRPQDYWVEKMRRLGFGLDEALTRQARDVARAGHFKWRGLVFVRA
ncbi:sulfotransferase family 2 domain-containing protein [Elongatibacter sediminis]|uniref:Sulfotransferase family 2 domain-containing protein n=1 Tax=Elongatibacter sediminis TaxID=3119006 RepID=A0AAW9RFT3_9GAMM